MDHPIYRFEFTCGLDPAWAEPILHVAALAVEGLAGEARARLVVAYDTTPPSVVILIEAGTPAGEAAAQLLTGYLMHEIGAEAFTVQRTEMPLGPWVGPVPHGEETP